MEAKYGEEPEDHNRRQRVRFAADSGGRRLECCCNQRGDARHPAATGRDRYCRSHAPPQSIASEPVPKRRQPRRRRRHSDRRHLRVKPWFLRRRRRSRSPEAERDAIFDPGISASEDGSGRALTIVQQVAEAHDWDVDVSTGADGGARFEIVGVDLHQ